MKIFKVLFCSIIFSTANEQWFWQNPLPQGNPLASIYFTDSNTGWAVGSIGTILKTTNGGNSWETQNSGTNETLSEVFFIDSNTGWVVAGAGNGLILKTTNGGTNWTYHYCGTPNSLASVWFIDSNTGWAVVLKKDDPALLDLLGWLLLLDKRYEESERILLQALELDPKNATAHLYLGMLYMQTRDHAAAKEHFAAARDLGNAEADAILNQYFP